MKKLLIVFSLFLILIAGNLYAQENNNKLSKGEIDLVKVLLKTNFGDITLELNRDKAPETVENFLRYVEKDHYNGTIFHRVIADFMIQGGGMDANLKEKPTDAHIKNEANNGLKNDKYTIAMARTSEPHSATSQFFINTVNNDFLNYKSATMQGWGYAVFGKVVEGQDVVDKIGAVETISKNFHDDVPKESVIIESVTIVE